MAKSKKGSAGGSGGSAGSGDAAGADDELRRKYREALARKKGHDHGPGGGPDNGGTSGQAQSAHTQRMFRRKSGG